MKLRTAFLIAVCGLAVSVMSRVAGCSQKCCGCRIIEVGNTEPCGQMLTGNAQLTRTDYPVKITTAGSTPIYLTGNGLQRPGGIQPTGRSTDLAIEGDGFFAVELEIGGKQTCAFTRHGSFTINPAGALILVSQDGPLLSSSARIPEDATEVIVSADGEVLARIAGYAELRTIGQIPLARFETPAGLGYVGNGLYLATGVSGEPIFDDPGTDGLGHIRQGQLESTSMPRFLLLVGTQ